jgi:two-component system NtrC family response regulator
MADILIIDDDKLICQSISNLVKQLGHRASFVHTLAEGLEKVQAEPFDVVFLDVRMPDGSGLDVLPKIKATSFSPEIIIITGFGDPEGAELAIKNDAWDYIEKPSSIQAIKLPLMRVLQYRAEKKASGPTVALKRQGIVGDSQKLSLCFDLLAQAASSDVNVLIQGETGTGKELFAWAIHNNSLRAGKNFVVVDCAALPETLVESVLFGHRKGAFTGADQNQDGLIKQADQGTLFLDEVGELPLPVQKSFLRVLQERCFRPVGGDKEVTSDFRLVAATNRNLEGMVKQVRFREDLLFRLRTFVIELPPLRECLEDIKDLTSYYMNRFCDRFGIESKGFSPEFWDVLHEYKWPGNVRELIQALERAILSAKNEPVLFPKHLPNHIRIQIARSTLQKRNSAREKLKLSPAASREFPKLQKIREAAVGEAERQYLTELISLTGGDIKKACQISGLSRSRFYTLLKKYRQTASG